LTPIRVRQPSRFFQVPAGIEPDAGVEHQDADAAELAKNCVAQPLHVRAPSHVGGDSDDAAPGVFDGGLGGLQPFAGQVGDRHGQTEASQAAGGGEADAARAAGDDRCPSVREGRQLQVCLAHAPQVSAAASGLHRPGGLSRRGG
jgi:hypothetical protein